MSVLIEGYSVVIKKDALDITNTESAFLSGIPNKTLTTDGLLWRVGFMDAQSAYDYANKVANLIARNGLRNIHDVMVIASQIDGLMEPREWINFGMKEVMPGKLVSACWCVDDANPDTIATPEDWHYEHSLSEKPRTVRTDEMSTKLRFLESDGTIDTYLDTESNEVVYIPSTRKS